MIRLAELWIDIRNDPMVMKTRFNPYFLTQVGEILANRGFHEAKIFLWDSCSDPKLRRQAEAIISIIGRMERMDDIQRDRSNGRFLLKEIGVMKSIAIID